MKRKKRIKVERETKSKEILTTVEMTLEEVYTIKLCVGIVTDLMKTNRLRVSRGMSENMLGYMVKLNKELESQHPEIFTVDGKDKN
jgi:hypothetical protein